MKGLTLTQPWATLVAIGAKRIETRSWRTNYRGPLAIHAAKGFPRDCHELCLNEPFLSALKTAGFTHTRELPRGVIVAVARLADVWNTDTIEITTAMRPPGCSELTEQERAFGDYSTGRFAWMLRDVRAVEQPLPMRGALGLWTVPRELREQIGGWSL